MDAAKESSYFKRQEPDTCFLFLKFGAGNAGLPYNRLKCANSDLMMVRDWNCNRTVGQFFLHNYVAPSLPYLNETNRAYLPSGEYRSLPNRNLNLRHKNVTWSRFLISSGEAVSKNSSSASLRLSRACSMVLPWLAISSSGHRATYPSPSFSIIAASLCTILPPFCLIIHANFEGFGYVSESSLYRLGFLFLFISPD